MQWSLPSFPEEPHDSPSLRVVDQAFLSKFGQGPLRTFQRPNRYLLGAVYDGDGRLVVESQKIGGLNGHPWVPADPRRVRVRPGARRLEGRWLYGGHWIQHFGHFIVETLSTLWPVEPDVEGLVFHKYLRKPVVHETWMLRLLELAGYGGLPIEVVGKSRAVRVERLVVPSRTVVAEGWGHPQAAEVWGRIAAPFRSDPRGRVFLSRTSFNESRRRAGQRARSTLDIDRALDRVFAALGFEVVAPESLTIDDQIRLVAGADVVAGRSGSALHLSAFAQAGTRVIEIGDERNLGRPIGLQRVIDRVCEHPHHFIRGDATPDAVAKQMGAILE